MSRAAQEKREQMNVGFSTCNTEGGGGDKVGTRVFMAPEVTQLTAAHADRQGWFKADRPRTVPNTADSKQLLLSS